MSSRDLAAIDTCPTCSGRGLVGGHLPARCPDCRVLTRDLTTPTPLVTPEAYEQMQRELAARDVEVARLRAEADASRAAIGKECVEHSELNGHIDIAEQCRDWLDHLATDEGDPTGKLQDFSQSLRVVIDQLDRQRRRANWYEAAYDAGKAKLIESAVDKALTAVRATARAYVHHVNQLGLAADDNDPKVIATAGPIGAAQAEMYIALGIYEEHKPCGFGVDGGDCHACSLVPNSGRAPNETPEPSDHPHDTFPVCRGEPHICEQELIAKLEGTIERLGAELADVRAVGIAWSQRVALVDPVVEAAKEWDGARCNRMPYCDPYDGSHDAECLIEIAESRLRNAISALPKEPNHG